MNPYYEDEYVTLYHGSCFDVDAWWEDADVMVTDPPYGMDYKSGWSGASVAGDRDQSARDYALSLWGWEKPALIFGRWSVPKPPTTRALLTWDKGDWPGMGDLKLPWGPSTEEIYVLGSGFVGKRTGTIIRHTERPGPTSFHPSQKPIGLMENLLMACPAPWVIAEPFAGSGGTLVAASRLGRKAIGVELEERYCEVIAKRLSQGALDFAGLGVGDD